MMLYCIQGYSQGWSLGRHLFLSSHLSGWNFNDVAFSMMLIFKMLYCIQGWSLGRHLFLSSHLSGWNFNDVALSMMLEF